MAKLFALEENTESSNSLLIDKVLERAQQPKSPLSLTADLLKQRQDLNKEVTDKLNENPEEESSDDASGNNTDTSNDTSSEEETPPSEDPKPKDDEEASDNKKESADTEEDAAAEDKDSLSSLVGSGLNENKEESKEEDTKKETATESFKPKARLSNLFMPITKSYAQYQFSLETYNLKNKALALEEQPIVYIKESVIESLNNLIQISKNYIENNTTFTKTIADSVKNLNERITVFKGFIDAEKYHFTNKMVNDKDILANISVPEKSDLRETSRILLRYIENSTKATSLVVSNDYSMLRSSYTNSDFIEEESQYTYKEVLPGFNTIHVSLVEYQNYLKTQLQEFQYYKLKVLKTEDLFNLEAVTITEDKELVFIMTAIDKLLVSIGIYVDNLTDINTYFTKFIDDIKVIIYDIEQDKYKDLASIDIDSKVKDFIKFKLSIESYYININMMIDYLTSVMSVLNVCVELKD